MRVGAAAILVLSVALSTPAIGQDASLPANAARSLMGANREEGRDIVLKKGCNACHVMSGVPGPFGRVGPSLDGLVRRAYIAGSLPNTPGSLVSWLMDPPRHAPRTAMPNFGLTRSEAMDIAAFLYSLPPR
ncbi:MAG: cytochrome C [Methylobacterium sp.]|nr:MAG: cytochrome C [Methylobacterium sp.]